MAASPAPSPPAARAEPPAIAIPAVRCSTAGPGRPSLAPLLCSATRLPTPLPPTLRIRPGSLPAKESCSPSRLPPPWPT
eukprot:2379976-Rhodomonas_salina.1